MPHTVCETSRFKGTELDEKTNSAGTNRAKTNRALQIARCHQSSQCRQIHRPLFQPRTCVESALVENMAVARWRQMRLWGMEQAGMTEVMQRQALRAGNEEAANRDAPTRSAIAFRTLCDHSRSLDIFNRYEARFERQYLRPLDRLEKMRAKSVFAKRTHLGARDPPSPKLDPSERGTF